MKTLKFTAVSPVLLSEPKTATITIPDYGQDEDEIYRIMVSLEMAFIDIFDNQLTYIQREEQCAE